MKILGKAEKSKTFWFLFITSFIFFLLRLPSFIEPYWYGDEGIYQVIGQGLRHGRLLYKDIWDNKPPLLYLLYALFSSDQFTIRLVSALFGIASIIAFYFLSQKLFKKNIAIFTTGIYAFLFSLPLLEGNIANSENFMLFPIILSGLLVYKSSEFELEKKYRRNFSLSYILHSTYYKLLFLAGLLLSFAFLFKIVAIFDFAAFFIFLIIYHHPKKAVKKNVLKIVDYINFALKTFLELLLGFLIPILITVTFFLLKGAFLDFFNASFLQNVGYVGYGNKLFFTQGLLVFKLIFLAFVILFLFFKREKLSRSLLFIFLWFSFSVFNAFFSGRPYTHYVLVLLPSFCLFLGVIFSEKKIKRLTTIICLVLIFIVYKNFWLYGKNISYYQNFFSFLLSKKSLNSYRSFFDSKTPRDYELASLVKIKKDTLFLWGNNAQIYALAQKLPPGRYTVAYHITSSQKALKETEKALSNAKPKFIIIMPDVDPFPFPLLGYNQKFMIQNATIYERNF